MDPARVRAYLQIACSGLGFDIGEVWWMLKDQDGEIESSASSDAGAVDASESENTHLENDDSQDDLTGEDRTLSNLRFVQLYTSKSYEDRRSMLVSPEKEDDESNVEDDGDIDHNNNHEANASSHKRDLAIKKHVLSPQLVKAISSTAQVLWATSQQTGGLLGKSDVRLQTAVGLPVAVDRNGNMCIVVMFSPNHIRNTPNAIEYLEFISKSATSSTIPCLLPVFDTDMRAVTPLESNHSESGTGRQKPQQQITTSPFGDGVVVNFITFDTIHNQTDVHHAQKDSFGIPMLPWMEPDVSGDAFDEASFGVWKTVMDTTTDTVVPLDQPAFPPVIRSRMEEFLNAFLSMSVFDAADIWIPRSPGLCHEVTVFTNDTFLAFQEASEGIFVQSWSGAVGRAYASGSPIWSHVPEVIYDSERRAAFEASGIQTVLAVPIANCVLCCYSLVRTDAVPFVLKFLQQALRLLWSGLDNVEQPQVGQEIWNAVGPTDLGEMAADLEMHDAFLQKNNKRPRSGSEALDVTSRDRAESLSYQLDNLASSFSITNVPISSNAHFTNDHSYGPSISFQGVGSSMIPQSGPSLIIPQNSNRELPLVEARYSPETSSPTISLVEQSLPWSTSEFGTKRIHVTRDTSLDSNKRETVSVPFPNMQHYLATNVPESQQGQSSQFFYFAPDTKSNNNFTSSITSVPTGFANSFQNISQQETSPQGVSLNEANNTQNQGIYYEPSSNAPCQQQQSFRYDGSDNLYQQPAPLQMPHQLPNQIVQIPVSSQSATMNQLNQQINAISWSVPHQYLAVDSSSFGNFNQRQYSAEEIISPQTVGGGHVSQSSSSSTPAGSVTPSNLSSLTSDMHLFCTPISASSNSISLVNQGGGGKGCRIEGCCEPAVSRRPYCIDHSGNRLCEYPGCPKCAQGSTRFCIAHGGGRRCTYQGCDKGARDKFFCAAHGGGKRCALDGCSKSAVGGSSYCTGHGGGRRCSVEGCHKSAQSSTKFCVKHGGGKTCRFPSCSKVARGRTPYCAAHGGGIRCKLEGCNRVAIGKLQLCRAHGGGAKNVPKMLNSISIAVINEN